MEPPVVSITETDTGFKLCAKSKLSVLSSFYPFDLTIEGGDLEMITLYLAKYAGWILDVRNQVQDYMKERQNVDQTK